MVLFISANFIEENGFILQKDLIVTEYFLIYSRTSMPIPLKADMHWTDEVL